MKCNISEIQLSELVGDRLQLSKVFINLLSNAIYHSHNSGSIDIKIDYLDFNYLVRVVNRGLETASSDLPWIFDRFYRAQEQLQGSDLWLYLSRQIVEAHGEKI